MASSSSSLSLSYSRLKVGVNSAHIPPLLIRFYVYMYCIYMYTQTHINNKHQPPTSPRLISIAHSAAACVSLLASHGADGHRWNAPGRSSPVAAANFPARTALDLGVRKLVWSCIESMGNITSKAWTHEHPWTRIFGNAEAKNCSAVPHGSRQEGNFIAALLIDPSSKSFIHRFLLAIRRWEPQPASPLFLNIALGCLSRPGQNTTTPGIQKNLAPPCGAHLSKKSYRTWTPKPF